MGDRDDDTAIGDMRGQDQERVAPERREPDVEARVEAADGRAAPRELGEDADNLGDLGEELGAGVGPGLTKSAYGVNVLMGPAVAGQCQVWFPFAIVGVSLENSPRRKTSRCGASDGGVRVERSVLVSVSRIAARSVKSRL